MPYGRLSRTVYSFLFGEVPTEDCGRCGSCLDTRSITDVTKEAQMVLSCIIRMGERFGKPWWRKFWQVRK
ncbi:RQC domain-containing protein [Bacillus licheniformis]|nr:RQC domain-containing protein [Bacillus licheniformis]